MNENNSFSSKTSFCSWSIWQWNALITLKLDQFADLDDSEIIYIC